MQFDCFGNIRKPSPLFPVCQLVVLIVVATAITAMTIKSQSTIVNSDLYQKKKFDDEAKTADDETEKVEENLGKVTDGAEKLVKQGEHVVFEEGDNGNDSIVKRYQSYQLDDDIDYYRHFNVGVLMASRLDAPFDLERCGPAVDLALDEINVRFLRRHRVKLTKVQASYPTCSGVTAPGLAADMHFRDDVVAFIGPACMFALEPVARLAAYWNTPIITGMGDQPPSEEPLRFTSGILNRIQKWNKNESSVQGIFKDKSNYPTLTRMSYCQCRLKLVFASIFKQFKWRHIALILDRSDLFSLTVGKSLEHGLKKDGFLAFVRELDGNDDESSYGNHLRHASMYARVVILSVRGVLVRKFMLAAHALGMTRGDWTFLDVEIFKGAYWGQDDWEAGDKEDSRARKAYESLLRVSLLQPASDEFHDFAENVRTRARRDYNYTIGEPEEVNFVTGAFYDGVYLLGMALNETLSELGDVRDGFAITRRMWNRSFDGITGQVRIDDNGDRDADYSISDLDPITGRFEVVAHYIGLKREYSAVRGKKIHWPGGSEGPPPDVPRCGFMGNTPECRDNGYVVILYSSFAFGVFLAFTATLVCITIKHLRVTADLNNMSWKVRPEEVFIEIGGKQQFGSRIGLQQFTEYVLKGQRDSITSCTSLLPNANSGGGAGLNGNSTANTATNATAQTSSSTGGNRKGVTIGYYKGNRVAIKRITRKKCDLSKKLLWEIKQVRDVTHENTVRFLGACIECPELLVLTEYCPKGSLRDVLGNEAIRLDWNFRMSLIHDIVKGMNYLHNSEVSVHGKLRSCTCLIDGRFVLKIANFGLRTLTAPSEVVKDARYYSKLLWVAPELLPLTVVPGTPATQRGDVYSFAIILEEIVLRGGPYHAARLFLEVPEIISRVASRESPPFRPAIQVRRDCPEDLLDLMYHCWSDDADARPTFEAIKDTVRNIMKGYCENLMDDLLRRMEQYANNLEALVSEKTEELSQEKRRSEELLYQVLPRPVAQQLMVGELVRPEQFECVTVYFSDIVGFTALCARSTPMQVVDFLNDLYSTFDRIIGFYDVYKVETIGDAYMVVSGLPERNGDRHAKEIGLMSLTILDAVRSFPIKHQAESKLMIRIGVHSGPVCAGIVGKKMPHYCLFGDTVNTASRLESTGEPLKIHISESTKEILEKFGTFDLTLRGEVELKGKGFLITYWLNDTTSHNHYHQQQQQPYGTTTIVGATTTTTSTTNSSCFSAQHELSGWW